jgi:hypothetical protein
MPAARFKQPNKFIRLRPQKKGMVRRTTALGVIADENKVLMGAPRHGAPYRIVVVAGGIVGRAAT